MEASSWERKCKAFLKESLDEAGDAAHDMEHVRRVVANARKLAEEEGANMNVVVPAGWLHDCVVVPKDSGKRVMASILAAERAADFLRAESFPEAQIPDVKHAIEAHSFSAGIEPRTLEAKVVQDADRLDALGAIGIARCMMVGGVLGTSLYHPEEPFPETREADDHVAVVDHFYTKLLRLAGSMQTASGRREAQRRTRFMRGYLEELRREIGIPAQ